MLSNPFSTWRNAPNKAVRIQKSEFRITDNNLKEFLQSYKPTLFPLPFGERGRVRG
jgi:hypothetical protein